MSDRTLCAWLAGLVLATAVQAADPAPATTTPDPEALRTIEAHLSFLASDAMGGRETGTVHGDITAAYIASVYRRLGLLPAGDGDGYLQAYPLTRSAVDLENTRLTLVGSDQEFVPAEDWALRGAGQGVELEAELVFAGHAVVDEESGLDQLAGLDLDGKLVLVRSGVPEGYEGLSERFDWRDQQAVVLARGAKGLVYFGGDDDRRLRQSRRWAGLSMRRTSLSLGLPDDEDEPQALRLYPGELVLEALLASAGQDLQTLLAHPADEPGFALDARLSVSVAVSTEVLTAHNAAALLPGADPELGDEVVVLSAHMDHIGIGDDGQINNGADDNASGTTTLLTVAEALARREAPLRRSVLFLAVSGEEKGLLGSEWWVDHPTWPLERVAANINMDMVGRNDPGSIGITPSAEHGDYNSMVELAMELGPAAGLEVDWSAGEGDFERKVDVYYRRSDHANFADQGIPVVFFFAGEHEDYHRPGDTAEKIDIEKVGRVAALVEALTEAVAQADERPTLLGEE